MRENCTYGSEGGEARKGLPYPYRVRLPHAYSYVRIVGGLYWVDNNWSDGIS
jgi:hypothetical protein